MEAKGLEPSNLLTASQALYQLSYAPEGMPALYLTGPGDNPRPVHSRRISELCDVQLT